MGVMVAVSLQPFIPVTAASKYAWTVWTSISARKHLFQLLEGRSIAFLYYKLCPQQIEHGYQGE